MIKIAYKGELRTESVQENGELFITDGPKEFRGKGEYFSPTDLVGVSLASCMLTLMGIAARKLGFDLEDADAQVDKEMSTTAPRRIVRLSVKVRSSMNPSLEVRQKLEAAALTCPVHASLHPEIKQELSFVWNEKPGS